MPTVDPAYTGYNPTDRWSTIYGIIVSQQDNVAVWLGRADGYVARDLFAFGVNTLLRLGNTAPTGSVPLWDYVLGEAVDELASASGPWG